MKSTFLLRMQKSWWFAWAAAAVLAITHLGGAVDATDKLLVLLKIRPDGLALAQNAEKGAFSRELTELAWRRMFWARSYCARVELEAAIGEQDEAWRSYISASEEWSSHIMVYIVSTERFYGVEKASQLEGDVQESFRSMASALVKLRYSKPSESKDMVRADVEIDNANMILYKFVRGISAKK